MRLPYLLAPVAGDDIGQYRLGALPGFEPRKALGSPERIDEGLGRDGGSGPDMGHERAAGEEAGGDRDPDLAGRRIACDE